MLKKFWGIFLIFCIPFTISGIDKRKKTYELVYKDIQLLKQQVIQIEKKINNNANDILIIKTQLKKILSQVEHFQKELASLKQNQKDVPIQYQVLIEKMEAINMQIAKFSESLLELKSSSLQFMEEKESPKEEKETQPPPAEEEKDPEEYTEKIKEESQDAPQSLLSPREVYDTAYSDYLKGSFNLAIEGFQMYLEQFPESPLADNSLFWIGECYFSQKKYKQAINHFNDFIINYPRGDKLPSAYLKKGICLMELGKKEEASSVFKRLISKFPLEEEARIAREKLKELEY
jgi:tol-pal system protein YbgF